MVSGFVNYTYQVVTQGSFGKQSINDNPSEQKILDRNSQISYQQKPVPQPRANMSLTFLTPKDIKHPLLLGNWSLNILASWRAGEWLNYNPNAVPEISNLIQNVQVKDYYNIDLRLNKSFDFKIFTATFFMDITNVLNTKRLSGASFYDTHDQRYYFESLHLPTSTAYDNISGDDRIGEVRKDGVPYQPIEQVDNVIAMVSKDILQSVIYYDKATRRYMEYNSGASAWSEVDHNRMQKILDDKAYIDMPNNSSFDFLNPRQIFFGFSLSFKI